MTDQPFNFPVQGTAPDEFTETLSFEQALNRALGVATARSKYRPGLFPEQFTNLTNGQGGGTPPVGSPVDTSDFGAVFRLTAARVIAPRTRAPIDEGVVVFARYRRAVDPTDPSGDTVQFMVRWLDDDFDIIDTATVQAAAIEVADGVQEVRGLINTPTDTTPPATAILTPPSGAVYVVPYVQTFGTDGQTDVIALGAQGTQTVLADFAFQAAEAQSVDAENVQFPDPAFTWPPESVPEFPIARTFYVAMNGDDTNTGTSASKPLRTIERALTAMQGLTPLSCVTIVHPGEYLVKPDSVIPADCALYGYDLRVTKLRLSNSAGTAPAEGSDRQNNMFRMRNGIKVRGFTLTGMEHESFTFDPATETGAPPEKGYAFVFNPGEFLTRSPYLADCTVLHDFTQAQLALPIDRAAGNPLMPSGCGNLYADGDALSGYSPLRSVVVDSFTAVNPNGVGYAIVKNALVQLVSVFTNWSRVGIWAHDGGQVTLANSNNTFGDYAFAATDSREAILIPDGTLPSLGVFSGAAQSIENSLEAIVSDLMDTRYPANVPGWASFTAQQRAFTENDTRLLLGKLANDLRSGQERATQRFIKGLFDWNGQYVFDSGLLPAFLESFDQIEAAVFEFVTATGPRDMISELIGLVKTVLSDPATYRVPFVSVVEFASQAFSYSGSGVNYNALPFAQRGTATLPDPTSTIVQWGGGRCYGTFSTEAGDTYLGNDLRVDFERSTVEGQAFSRGVQNITLPLIIALG